jgi:hypothetical protein
MDGMIVTMTDNEHPVVPPTEVRPRAKRRAFSAERAEALVELQKRERSPRRW